jgi:cation:H+ antiporter
VCLCPGGLDRIDGIILILAFFAYAWWLFAKDSRFKKVYNKKELKTLADGSSLVWAVFKMVLILLVLLGASYAIVFSAQYFSSKLHISLGLVGIIIVGLGNCFPEIYFSIISARKEENWLVLGDLMGSVIVCATLVLGIVAVVAPFQIENFTPFLLARVFMIIACFVYIFFINTGRKITKKEGLLLLFIYIGFLLSEIFIKL